MKSCEKNVLHKLNKINKIYHQAWDESPDAILLINEQGQILLTNINAETLFGYSSNELIGKPIERLIPSRLYKHQKIRSVYIQCLHKRDTLTIPSLVGLTKDGKEFSADIRLKPTAVDESKFIIAFIRDLTDRVVMEDEKKKLQEQLFQSQKLEALGQLTGGIAHDFNNILNVIDGFTEIAIIRNGDTDGKLAEYLSQIHTACNHGCDLIAHMMSFARKEKIQKQLLTLTPIVNDAMKMLRTTLPSSIKIDVRLNGDPSVFVDPGQFHQVITNLCINARDAMPTGGRLEVCLEVTDPLGARCMSCHEEFSGNHVELRIKDNGMGISKETLNKMFEPLFTTKEKDKGTGLGLAIVNDIVHQHDGHILVESEPDKGTTFRIHLPLVA